MAKKKLTPIEQAGQARQDLVNSIAQQQASRYGNKLPEDVDLADEQKLEKKIRYYVMKMGGFTKGLTKEEMEYAKELLKEAGRPDEQLETPQWDMNIALPGYDR
jgi:hypothetical protein